MENYYQLAKSVAINLLRGSSGTLTKETIAASVATAISLKKEWQDNVDAAKLVRDLEAQYSVWIGRAQTLEDVEDHIPWLDQKRSSITWSHWQRYRELLNETWPPASIEALDEVTDEVLMRLEEPTRPGSWDRRGLVVGHVQSGKTANYIGLINKAVDAGYQLIVVLAGIHKSLRSQTQIRLDEGFLGYESPTVAASQGVRSIGVGRIAPVRQRPNTITNRSDGGDFKRATANNFGINPGGTPLLFVIKKNASVLNNLLEWVEWAAIENVDGRPRIRDVPLLVIDDEADNASVDTRQQAFDENGAPDAEHDPTTINRRIRRLLHCFERAAYVGYTATPFANIFIHERGRTTDEGDDLFPRSFIVSLPAPSDYVSPLRVFGLAMNPDPNKAPAPALPIVRTIADHVATPDAEAATGWMPSKHNKEHRPTIDGVPGIPASLEDAILAFILACAARRVRGQQAVHNSMLIHVTRFTAVQELVFDQVNEFVSQLRNRIQWGEGGAPDCVHDRLQVLWERDFRPTSLAMGGPDHSWKDIAAELWNAASPIKVRRINGTAPDILDYESHRGTGLTVIAIGGDKLARGLTLEGLSVSYFLRATKMYDTLMQMGRWFGYRPGYLDLCRMYMTDELKDWFEHVTAANEELREEFDRMVAVGGTPRDYGLKVKSHPSLLITANVKMRNGTDLDLSFEGGISETVSFQMDEASIRSNFDSLVRFTSVLGVSAERDPIRERPSGQDRWEGSLVWNDVPAAQVISFLRLIVTPERAYRVQPKLMATYIERVSASGEMTQWTVALIGTKDEEKYSLGELSLAPIQRKLSVTGRPQAFSIGRLLSPRDEAIDLDAPAWGRALGLTTEKWIPDPIRFPERTEPPKTPGGPYIRQVRSRDRGLLLLYLIVDTKEGSRRQSPAITLPRPLVGVAVSFPSSATRTTVKYKVNNVYWQQEFGAPD